MIEPRFRIRAIRSGHPDGWLSFTPRKAITIVDHPTLAYHASCASIEAILRQRGKVFGPYDLAIEGEEAPKGRVRAYTSQIRAGRTRRMYLAVDRNGRASLTIYPFEAFVGLEQEVEEKAAKFFPSRYQTEEVD